MNICKELNKFKYCLNLENKNVFEDEDLLVIIDSAKNKKSYLENVIVKYKEYGTDFLKNIEVLYSIFICDKKADKIIVAKDMVGLSNIYYHVNDNAVYIANDIIELMDINNLKKEINEKALSIYFRLHYIKPPETIFSNVYKLEHGQYLVYDGKNLETEFYWEPVQKFNENKKFAVENFDEAKNQVREKIENYVKNIVTTEENCGIYLSGGIDSSLITALASKYCKNKIKTFSIGFYEKECNEAEKSKRIAEYFGTDHHELYISEDVLLDKIKMIPVYYTEPFADASELATLILNEFAKENGVEYALTGDGADQLFCGCGIYDTIYKTQKAHKKFNPFNIHISPKLLRNKRKLILLYSNTDKKYRGQGDIVYEELFFKGLFKDDGLKRLEKECKVDSKDWQERRLIVDFDTYLCDGINTKMGVPARKNGIEVKSTFLNKDLITYSFKIPHKYKYNNGNKKYILKEILYEYLPKEYIENKKRGFAIPTQKWLQTYLNKDLKRLSAKEFIEKQNIFNYDVLNKILNNIDDSKYAHIIWDYYMFQIWYEKYMA